MRIPPERGYAQSSEWLAKLLDGSSTGEAEFWRAIGPDGFGPDCPSASEWERYFAGQLPASSAEALLHHAAECRGCGARLLFWSGTVHSDESPEERETLNGLGCMQPGWQAGMAQRLQDQPRRGGRVLLWGSMLGLAGAIAAGTLLFLFIGSNRAKSPEHLLAEAYAQDRTIELRIPLAGYAAVTPPQHTRGAGEEEHEPVPLLEARAAITQALLKSPEDPKLLLLEARADLLNQNYDSAIDTLRRLEVQNPKDVAVLTDLATAYQQRAVATDTATDRAAALDAIEQAARLAPQDPVVLYNEALLMEQVYQYLSAVDVWKKYLSVERDPEWHADGQRHLDAVTKRLAREQRNQSELTPYLATPEGMLHLARSPDLLAVHDEELSTVFLSRLLQSAFPLPSPTSKSPQLCDAVCSASLTLLRAVSSSIEARHHDRWLNDFLSGADKPGFAEAVEKLAASIDEGQHTRFSDGLRDAETAGKEFTAIGDQAGAIRAGLEMVFDDARLLDDRSCLTEAAGLPARNADDSYPWMAAQFWTDESSCHLQQNDFTAANASLDRALRISGHSGYGIVHLRALGFLASNEESQGDRAQAWKMSLEGLRTYWNGDYPAMRKMQFYGNLVYAEGNSERVHAETQLLREATHMLASMEMPQNLAANQMMLATAEIRAGEEVQGRADLAAGFRMSNEQGGWDRNTAETEISFAAAYQRAGDIASADGMLHRIPGNLDLGDNGDLEMRYALVQGEVALAQGQYQAAEQELSRARSFAEQGLASAVDDADREGWMEKVRPVYASLAQLALREGKPPEEVLSLWERYRLFSNGANPRRWCQDDHPACLSPAIEAFMQHLDGRVVVGTIRLDRSLLVWEMNGSGLRFREVALDPARFDLLCHAFAESVASSGSAESGIRALGTELVAQLLGPFAADLGHAQEVIFDLDDSMEYLPVNALPWRDSYLGLVLPVEEVRSLLRVAAPQDAERKSLVVGASMPAQADLVRLPEAQAEAATVAAMLPDARLLTGSQATPETMEKALPGAKLVHFAGHARMVEGATRLMLAAGGQDGAGTLDMREIPRHALASCRLFVLSACATGSREDRDLGDAADVARTLSADGVSQTVAAHWEVDSAASESLMKVFYAELAAGKTVSAAWMESERELSAQSGYHHPYFWASYSVFGMNRENLKELFQR
ncbi:CHAT domain-containing protein [Silvibacterium dinghuense]|uniref:CHAT domain-containing protein n=1 Tax=Silvibacterium dinghuense TaxID=1560006 RepID=A0A4Q1S8S4_9BACT|nr:CHAT domain-containing protein [Silvibacterium dinghuense]RXS93400.1 CHAT domain-containing protein [Silvibacterium dinghuense]